MTLSTFDHGASDAATAWEAEYKRGGIPSSTRKQPSNVVVEFVSYIERRRLSGDRQAIDIGCGSGRNSLFLAEIGFSVLSMDFVKAQIEMIENEKRDFAFGASIKAIWHDVSTPWPATSGGYDIAVDTFCFKHLIKTEAVAMYVREISRSLKSDGYLLLFLAAKEDGYYARHRIPNQQGPGAIIRDPGNNVFSRLYDVSEVADIFQTFDVVQSHSKLGRNEMHGEMYDRKSHVIYLRKR